MIENCSNDDLFKWAGWILSLALGILGLIAGFIVLWIRLKHSERLAKIKDRHDSIDRAIKAISDLEDITLSYWTEKETKHRKANIIIALQRLTSCLNQLAILSNEPFPSSEMYKLRVAATMDMETSRRPVSSNSDRIVNFTIATSKLLNSKHLQKKW